jgi:hypothetical protein
VKAKRLTRALCPAIYSHSGINLTFLSQALAAAKRSDGRGRWSARITIRDEVTAVQSDNDNGFYLINIPRSDGAFVTKRDSRHAA